MFISHILFTSHFSKMDIEKQFQQPSQFEPLIQGHFFLNNLLTRLVIFPDSLHFSNQKIECTYLINFDMSYDISRDTNGWVLTIHFPEQIKFFSLLDLDDWEPILKNLMKRRRFHQFYKGVKKIGKGNFASVYLTQRVLDNKYFAVKAFQKQSTFKPTNGKEGLQNQINILRRLNHPNITQLEGVFETENSIYLVMDLIQGKSLGEILDQQKLISPSSRKKIIKGILSALAQMDNQKIVHRDIKPENIMIDANGEAKIVDFGLATITNVTNYLYVRCGTPGFVAPEIISIRDTDNVKMSTISDVFSAGAIFYQMIFGKALFDGDRNSQVLQKNRKCSIHIPNASDIISKQGRMVDSSEIVLLRRMLEINPQTRITAAQALNSTYFSQTREPLQEIGLSQRQTFTQHIPNIKINNSVRHRKVKRMENNQN